MQIKITPRTLGGTEFTAQPARLHLGAQNAEGVDRLVFQLPAEWAGCSVTLHIRHSDGTLAAPLVLDAAHSAPVGRSFTGWPAGQWMLAATDGSGYTAYTRPGRYDVYDILPTDGTEEEPSPSVYEQFIAQVSGQAEAAVQAAQSSAASEASAARQAQAAAIQGGGALRQGAAHGRGGFLDVLGIHKQASFPCVEKSKRQRMRHASSAAAFTRFSRARQARAFWANHA